MFKSNYLIRIEQKKRRIKHIQQTMTTMMNSNYSNRNMKKKVRFAKNKIIIIILLLHY